VVVVVVVVVVVAVTGTTVVPVVAVVDPSIFLLVNDTMVCARSTSFK
jgi:hypothetical protein